MLKLRLLTLLLLAALFNLGALAAQEYSPNQILFKTTQSLELQRGRTGLTAFDTFLNGIQAKNVRPLKSMPGNRWFSANLEVQPDWNAVKNNSLHFDGIDIIQPNYLNTFHVTPNDPWYSMQQMNLVSLPDAWNYTTGSSTIIVAVVDSGILRDHPDLQGNIYFNPNEIPDNGIDDDNNGYIDDYCGWDFADAPEMSDVALGDYLVQDNDVTDENFHGTHVSGILGAVTNNGLGVAGVCWNVKILPLRAGFRTSSGTGFLQDDDAAAAIIYGADMGASAMNMSWGDPNYSPIIADACTYAYEKGVTLVASAGNDPGPNLSYPAKLASVISVGAVDPYKNLAGFSSYGAELDLVAPGQNIYSTYKSVGFDMYKEMSGTSMSAPFVTGAAALLKSVLPNLTPQEVRARILTATDDLGTDGFDLFYGHGLLNARKLMENISSPVIEVTYPPDRVGVSADFEITGTVSGNNFFRYSVMCALDTGAEGLIWKDVYTNSTTPTFYEHPVFDSVLARFVIQPLMPEGAYILRIQYVNINGDVYNLFRSVIIDQTPPTLTPNTFQVLKRYDGQNVRFYAGALFNEPVRAELIVYSEGLAPFSCFPAKLDSIQVWQLPNTIPQGSIDLEIIATNFSNLTYHSPLFTDAAEIEYEIVTDYDFESRIIGNAMVPLNKFQDLDLNGIPEFMAMDLPTSGYGLDRFYEPTDTTYLAKHTYATRFWPLDMGNTNSSGQELLALNLDTAYLYETTAPDVYPATSIWSETGISGGIIADYNGDGTKDILLVKNLPTERVIQLHKRIGPLEVSTPKIVLQNTSQTSLRNMFVPTIICQNLDNDALPDILTADTDGDVMIYEATGAATAELTWSRRLPIANTYYLTSGDYDGDGTTDFFVGGYSKDVLDANQTYWFFEGFTSTGNNQYTSMGYIQFSQVLSQNAIQSYDVDNDGKHEIILSISPNLYVVEYDNGKFKPVFYGSSMRTYSIAAWEQNDQAFFITNQNDSADSLRAVVWSKQQPFTGPATPANLIVTPLNGHQVSLSWQENGADFYRIYRKESTVASQLLAEINSVTFLDTTVVADTTYMYCISAVSAGMSPPESIPTRWIETTPKPQPLILEIKMIGANEVRLVFDQPLSSASLNPGCYRVDHNIGLPLSVNSVLNQHGVQLRFRDAIPETDSLYLIQLQNVTGLTGVEPAQMLYAFSYNPDYTPPFIQQVMVLPDKRSVEIILTETVYAPTAQLLSNYELRLPANDALNEIQSISVNDNTVTIKLKQNLKYSNQPYYLILQNISDLAGNRITPNQNSCKFALTDINNLDKVVVYPNPVKSGDHEGINFLNFPPDRKGKLSIFNTAGDLVYQASIGPFNPNNNNITCRWELKNQAGRKVSSGIYFYLINMGDDTKKGKIAVIN
jgi:subtilisin family serine protease